MIAVGVHYSRKAYKKHQKKKEEQKRLANGEIPPVIDQSDEFDRSSVSSATPSGRAEMSSLNHAPSTSSRYSSTTSEPNSAIELNSARSTRSSQHGRNTAASIASSEDYRQYQKYVEGESSAYQKDLPDLPPAYEPLLSPVPMSPAPMSTHLMSPHLTGPQMMSPQMMSPQLMSPPPLSPSPNPTAPNGRWVWDGRWIFILADDAQIDPRMIPSSLPPPGLPPTANPFMGANELPADVPAESYSSPTASEMPAHVIQPHVHQQNLARDNIAAIFEMPADSIVSQPRRSDDSQPKDEEMK